MESQKISLNLIRTDCGTQMRINKKNSTIDDYAEQIAAGTKFPPVVVFTDGIHYWLVDGFHRYFAHLKLGLDTIECEVHQGTLNDALDYACRANQTHGLQRTNADKRHAVEEYFKIPGREELSNSEVAMRLGLSAPFVRNVREKQGVKASPSAHVGVGSSQKLKRLNSPKAEEELKRFNNPATRSGMVEVSLPVGHPQQFVTILAGRFEKDYLEYCFSVLHDTLKSL